MLRYSSFSELLLQPYLLGTVFTVMTDCRALLTLKENSNLFQLEVTSYARAYGLAAVQFWYQAYERGGELGMILDLQSFDHCLESDLYAYGSGILSLALAEEQKAEAK
jgi:hypothetical protein